MRMILFQRKNSSKQINILKYLIRIEMKKIIALILLCGFLSTANAQKQSYQEKKATTNAQHIADTMDLNDSQQTVLYAILLGKYEETSNQIKGNDLSNEEKKIIYKVLYHF